MNFCVAGSARLTQSVMRKPSAFAVSISTLALGGCTPQEMNLRTGYVLGFLCIFFGSFLYFKHPEKIPGFTLRQFKWCCIGMILGGVTMVVALLLDGQHFNTP